MPYGYIGQNLQNQTAKNAGVYSITDAADLKKQGKFGGSLKLLQSETVTSGSTVDFTNLGDYRIHFLTYENIQASGTTELRIRVSNDGGSTFESGSSYPYFLQYINSEGTFSNPKGTDTGMRLGNRVGNNRPANGYVYFYQLTASNNYSFFTSHSTSRDTNAAATGRIQYGGGQYQVAEAIDALRCYIASSYAFNDTGYIKLYGVKTP